MSKKQTLPSCSSKRVFTFADAYKRFAGDSLRLTGSQREQLKESLGGKGAGLAEMTALGVRVPPGLTITTDCCRQYYEGGRKLPAGLFEETLAQLATVEKHLGRRLGDTSNPLLLSVRSGAKFSMPGMMDTILNLGLNDETVAALAKITGNERFAWDSYRRFIEMYSDVVLGVPRSSFDQLLEALKEKCGAQSDQALTAEQLKQLVAEYKLLVTASLGSGTQATFPQNVHEQLRGAIDAVFRSWNNSRAIFYRNRNKIDHEIGTAVTVQAMVFGNRSERSGTGVCFTRNPSTGEKKLYGDYLVNAQGEDVVAGTRTPEDISTLSKQMPAVFTEFSKIADQLERHYRDVQDIEFTIEEGILYVLQTRTAKRTAQAAVSIAVALAGENLISRQEALLRIEPEQLTSILLPSFDPKDKERARKEGRLIATGLNASPGAASGRIVFCPDEAERLAAEGEKVMLVRVETCPDDIHGITAAQGVVTARGGMTSHAAVVARGMGKPCVVGCSALTVDENRNALTVGIRIFGGGDVISMDGSTGEVFEGEIRRIEPEPSQDFLTLLGWADQARQLGVRANADNPEDARAARQFGAEGIGLCRTEHMFMSSERLPVVQEMILASDEAERRAALARLLPMQRQDFLGIFKAMDGLPVTIRLLDPPLHEFLPKAEDLRAQLSALAEQSADSPEVKALRKTLRKVEELHETNPMMGLRGCRLGLLYPEINEMQVEAIFEAACIAADTGCKVLPEVMIPLVGHENELAFARQLLEAVALRVMESRKTKIPYKFGTMIEVPRAALTADRIACHAEFFSFGTNDLTQMTFGFSRDDAESKFLRSYLEGVKVDGGMRKVLSDNPFEVLDEDGVGKLMKIAIEDGKRTRPDLKLGICGEHGGEPRSIALARRLGLTYVSCSPFRVPVARLAAAQATILSER